MSLQATPSRQNLASPMEAKSQESGSESDTVWNLYIVYEPARFGGPFGVYSNICEEALMDCLAKPVKILMEIPGKGHLSCKLEKAMKLYAVKKSVPWFDLNIEEFLTYLAEVLSEDFDSQRSVHYASMMDIE